MKKIIIEIECPNCGINFTVTKDDIGYYIVGEEVLISNTSCPRCSKDIKFEVKTKNKKGSLKIEINPLKIPHFNTMEFHNFPVQGERLEFVRKEESDDLRIILHTKKMVGSSEIVFELDRDGVYTILSLHDSIRGWIKKSREINL